MAMSDSTESPSPAEVADYVAEMTSQLAVLAHAAGLSHTSAALLRAHHSALADLCAVRAAPNDAA